MGSNNTQLEMAKELFGFFRQELSKAQKEILVKEVKDVLHKPNTHSDMFAPDSAVRNFFNERGEQTKNTKLKHVGDAICTILDNEAQGKKADFKDVKAKIDFYHAVIERLMRLGP